MLQLQYTTTQFSIFEAYKKVSMCVHTGLKWTLSDEIYKIGSLKYFDLQNKSHNNCKDIYFSDIFIEIRYVSLES